MIKDNKSITSVTEYRLDPESSSSSTLRSSGGYGALHELQVETQDWAREFAVSDEDSAHIMVYEKGNLECSSTRTELPLVSAAHLLMHATLFDIEGFGWWSRDLENPQRRQLSLSLTGLRFPDESNKDRFLELSKEHAAYCWNAEPDTLIYSAGIVTDCIGGDIDIELGDLIFVMGCTDENAVEKHLNDPKHIALGYQLHDAGVKLMPTFSRTYRTTGDGFFFVPAT